MTIRELIRAKLRRQKEKGPINEMAAVSPKEARFEGLALLLGEEGALSYAVLYDPNAVYETYLDEKKLPTIEEFLIPHIYGAIFLNKDCPGTKTVEISAARDKYGPLMYDIAMSVYGYVAPDRYSVSEEASSVWKHYHDKRDDVIRSKLDCETNHSEPWLNLKYKRRRRLGLKSITGVSEYLVMRVTKMVNEQHGERMRPSGVMDQISYAGSQFANRL